MQGSSIKITDDETTTGNKKIAIKMRVIFILTLIIMAAMCDKNP